MSDVLSALDAAWAKVDALREVRYYATAEEIPPGQVLQLKAGDYTHEAWLFHPDDFGKMQASTPMVRWVHLRDAPPKMPPITVQSFVK